jgi:ectoine hydroxylase-related dioxygenase (phytanoyl-CoA dioxygenase family)
MDKFLKDDKTSIISFYKTNGYVVIKDLFSKDEIEMIKNSILEIFYLKFNKEAEVYDRIFLNEYYLQKKSEWKNCAKRMWDSIPFLRSITKPEIYNILKVIGLKKPIIATRPEVRTDMPEDDEYRQPWHQDWRYGQTSLNAVTIWVPMHDVFESDGTIELLEGSHKLGLLSVKEELNPRRFIINDEKIDFSKLRKIKAELNLGECIIFSQFTVHQSGFNISGKPRMSFQGRFADLSDPDFNKRGFPVYSINKLELNYSPPFSEILEYFKIDR